MKWNQKSATNCAVITDFCILIFTKKGKADYITQNIITIFHAQICYHKIIF